MDDELDSYLAVLDESYKDVSLSNLPEKETQLTPNYEYRKGTPSPEFVLTDYFSSKDDENEPLLTVQE